MTATRVRRVVTVLAVVGLLAIAGCAGVGDDPDSTPTDDTTPTADGDDTTTDGVVAPGQLRVDALSAIAGVGTYRVTATQETVVDGPQPRTTTVTDRAAIDRSDRELRRNRTISAPTATVDLETYVVDRTVYERSDIYVQQYGAEWIRSDVSENFSRTWRLQDVLGQLERVLDAADADDVTVSGVETVDGRETYRTQVDVSAEAFRGILSDVVGLDSRQVEGLDVDDVTYVYWLDADTARPVRTTANLSFSVTLQGQTFDQTVSTDTRFEYDDDVAIELPAAASDAVNVTGGATPQGDVGGVTRSGNGVVSLSVTGERHAGVAVVTRRPGVSTP